MMEIRLSMRVLGWWRAQAHKVEGVVAEIEG
jgi:hypothetical protein